MHVGLFAHVKCGTCFYENALFLCFKEFQDIVVRLYYLAGLGSCHFFQDRIACIVVGMEVLEFFFICLFYIIGTGAYRYIEQTVCSFQFGA